MMPTSLRCNNYIKDPQAKPMLCAICNGGHCWYAEGARFGEAGSIAGVAGGGGGGFTAAVKFPHPFTTLEYRRNPPTEPWFGPARQTSEGVVMLPATEVLDALHVIAKVWTGGSGHSAAMDALNAVERLAGLPATKDVR